MGGGEEGNPTGQGNLGLMSCAAAVGSSKKAVSESSV